jgi:CHAT domain-containing protein/Tfp pilus assembly protein PilF
MSGRIRTRSGPGICGPLLLTAVLILTNWSPFFAAAADPLTSKTAAPEKAARAKREQQAIKEVQRLVNEAKSLEEAGKLAEAITDWERAVVIARPFVGNVSEFVARIKERLAQLREARTEWRPARQARQTVLLIRTKLYGEKDWRVTDARLALEQTNRLSLLSVAQRRELEQAKSTIGEIVRLSNQRQYGKAIQLEQNVLAIRKRALGEAHRDYASSLNDLGLSYYNLVDYARAEPLFLQALEIRKKALGEPHPDYASSLNNLASLYQSQGDYAKAEPLFRQALEIRKQVLEREHPDYALSLNNLAGLYCLLGDYAKAEPLLRQALELDKKARGEWDPAYAADLNTLSLFYTAQGDYANAERAGRQALEIVKKVLGEAHPYYAISLTNLAELYQAQGDYARAEPVYRQALEVGKKVLGESHPEYASILENLARLYQSKGEYTKVEPLIRQALAIYRKVLGESHPEYAAGLVNLSALYELQGDYAKAEPLCRQALEIDKNVLGKMHPRYAAELSNLGGLYVLQRDYEKAEPLCWQAVAIKKKALGEMHPEYAASLKNLAVLYSLQGHYAQAKPLVREALTIYEQHFANALQGQSERQQLAFADSLRENLDLYLRLARDNETSAAEVYRHVLAWKGAIFSAQSKARRARANPEVKSLFDELLSVSTRLSTLYWTVPDPKKRQVWLRQIGDLTDRKEDLERDLATKSAEFRLDQEAARLTPEQLQRVLPKGATLFDFLEFDSEPEQRQRVYPGAPLVEYLEFAGILRPETKGPSKRKRRLVAFVVRSDRPVVRVDLGPVQPLMAASDRWRQSILGVPEEPSKAPPATPQIDAKPSRPPERLLRERLWNPLVPYLQGADLVMISPDGFLNQVPLAALPGREPGTYLVEETQLVTVPVPRELPALLKASGPKKSASDPSLLLVGNVDFWGNPGLGSIAQRDVALVLDPNRAAARDSGGFTFGSLRGTAAEIEDVALQFRARFPGKEIKALQKSAATEDAFRAEAPRHRWIHLATHGFFAPENVRSRFDRDPDDERRVNGELFRSAKEVRGFHPGLLSGIALAGANVGARPPVGFSASSGKEADDGILTALEVGGLNLQNVDLVVLSACETGLGRVAGGEGVMGLQRAFQLAGAKNAVASLWKVDDRATVALMRVFYNKLWVEQKPAAVALREAQLSLLRHPDQIESLATTRRPDFSKTVKLVDHGKSTPMAKTASPRLWAAFVISGTGN